MKTPKYQNFVSDITYYVLIRSFKLKYLIIFLIKIYIYIYILIKEYIGTDIISES